MDYRVGLTQGHQPPEMFQAREANLLFLHLVYIPKTDWEGFHQKIQCLDLLFPIKMSILI